MLFNSLEYIFLFVPVVILVYFFLNKQKLIKLATIWLIIASLFFYGFFTVKYIPLLLFSIIFNYLTAVVLNLKKISSSFGIKKIVLISGVTINVLLLCYFKYMDFFIENINTVLHTNISLLHIALPLGISFFTFQQIAYICDIYSGEARKGGFLNYALFVSFFPKLSQGPIARNNEVMPDLLKLRNKFINWQNMTQGLVMFVIGLFKKVVIADTLAKWANLGFNTLQPLSIMEAWSSILSYTLQIYYDFSGYTTMALGVGLMLNIKLPENFNNPYIALDIQDFWRRWHITLSRFLKDYLYIPLGGNRKGTFRTYLNIAIIFFVCGLWHGASWMFVIWGLLHGAASIINRLWKQTGLEIPKWLAWLITFIFVNVAWVFFRAPNWDIAKNILTSAIGLNGFSIPKIYGLSIIYSPDVSLIPAWDTIILGVLPILVAVIFIKYFHRFITDFKPRFVYSVLLAVLFLWSFLTLINPDYSSPFIYFNF